MFLTQGAAAGLPPSALPRAKLLRPFRPLTQNVPYVPQQRYDT